MTTILNITEMTSEEYNKFNQWVSANETQFIQDYLSENYEHFEEWVLKKGLYTIDYRKKKGEM